MLPEQLKYLKKMYFSKLFFIIIIIIIQLVVLGTRGTNGYRILTVIALAGRSNMNFLDPIHLELAKKGHKITLITPTQSSVKHENIEELEGLDFSKAVSRMVTNPNFFKMRLSGEKVTNPYYTMATKLSQECEDFYDLPVVKNLISGGAGQYDLVMTTAFLNECVFGIFHSLNTSTVIISGMPTVPWYTGEIGTPTPLSFIPHINYEASQEMSFLERIENVASYWSRVLSRNYVFLPAIEKVYQKHIPEAPGVNEILRNVSVILGAGHPSFGPLRPSMPDLIDDIGGIHCRPAKELPKEIKEMIGDKQFIFFSLGSVVPGHQMPANIFQAFVKTFAKFPQYRILWKWETDKMMIDGKEEKLPENVRLSKWFPQQDILGHANCKLFITHGGIASLYETIYHGVPVIGIPFYGDQDWNLKQVEYHGTGRKLDILEISEDTVTSLVRDLLINPRYAEQAAKRSILFRDRQVPALDRAVWNIEYVLRHGGAQHLRSPARNMNIVQYYCVDVVLFAVGLILLPITVLLWFIRKLCSRSKDKSVSQKKNKTE